MTHSARRGHNARPLRANGANITHYRDAAGPALPGVLCRRLLFSAGRRQLQQ